VTLLEDASATRSAATTPASGARLVARGVRLAYDDHVVVDGLDLEVPHGQITAIVGANACGKSTLLRALARLLTPTAGTVLLDGQEITRLPTREVARRLGMLPQGPVAPEGLTVEDLVSRGRFPHQRLLRRWSAEDQSIVEDALRATGVDVLRDRPIDELSGGQRQRSWIAMALAQDTELLLLDEPTTYLDLAHQLEVLDLLAELNEERGRTVVMVLHDLAHACRYADHVVAMKDGAVHATGAPREVVTAEFVNEVFGVRCQVAPCPVTGTPLCLPLGRAARRRPRGGRWQGAGDLEREGGPLRRSSRA
jgi:iron complex transport system ATP-binding protein